ncbi:MAG: hypothetical protein FWG90_04330 [Oscillospiraceae bacterium]|nr:hypothetical protein [Oscillospiraceae bacterium]
MLLIKKIKIGKHRILSVAVAFALLLSVTVQYSPFLFFAYSYDGGDGGDYYDGGDDGTDNDLGGGTGSEGLTTEEEVSFGASDDSSSTTNQVDLSYLSTVGYDITDLIGGWSFNNTSGEVTILNGANVMITGTASNALRVVVASGATAKITLNNAKITPAVGSGIELMGGANVAMSLVGESTVSSSSHSGIQMRPYASPTTKLVIDGSDGGGKLIANGGSGGAGIGCYSGASGMGIDIEIKGGIIEATGGSGGGSGIGSASNGGTGMDIKVSGGVVTAKGNGANSAGVGGGVVGGTITVTDGYVNAGQVDNSISSGPGQGIGGRSASQKAFDINISGGTVVAVGSTLGSGILGKNVNISGGAVTALGASGISYEEFIMDGNVVIYAKSTSFDTSTPGGSNDGEIKGIIFKQLSTSLYQGAVYGDVTLEVSELTIELPNGESGTLYIQSDSSLTIPNRATLTIPSNITVTNNGTLTVNGTLTNNGAIDNSSTGIINGNGAINGNGTIKGNPPQSGVTVANTISMVESDLSFDETTGTLQINTVAGMTEWWNTGKGGWLELYHNLGIEHVKEVILGSGVSALPNGTFDGCIELERITFLHTTLPSGNMAALGTGIPSLVLIHTPNIDPLVASFGNDFVNIRFEQTQGGTLTAYCTWTGGSTISIDSNTFVRKIHEGKVGYVGFPAEFEAGLHFKGFKNHDTVLTHDGNDVFVDVWADLNSARLEILIGTPQNIPGFVNNNFIKITAEFSDTANIQTEIETEGNSEKITNPDASIEIDLGTSVTTEGGNSVTIDMSNIFSLVLNIDDEDGISTVNELIDFLEGTTSATEFVDDVKKHIATNGFSSNQTVVLGFDISLLLSDEQGNGIKIIDLGDGMVAATFALPSELAGKDILFLGVHKNSAGGNELLKFTTGVNLFTNSDGTITLHMSKFSNFFLMGAPKARPAAPGPMVVDGGSSRGRSGASRTVVANSPTSTDLTETENTETEEIENTDGTDEENGLTEESGLTVENSTTPPPPPPPPPPTTSSNNFPSAPTTGRNQPSSGNSSSSSEGSSAPSRTRTTSSDEPSSPSTEEEVTGGLDEQGGSDIPEGNSDVYYAEGIAESTDTAIAAVDTNAVSPAAGTEGTKPTSNTVPIAAAAAVGTVAVGGGAAFAVRGIRIRKLK